MGASSHTQWHCSCVICVRVTGFSAMRKTKGFRLQQEKELDLGLNILDPRLSKLSGSVQHWASTCRSATPVFPPGTCKPPPLPQTANSIIDHEQRHILEMTRYSVPKVLIQEELLEKSALRGEREQNHACQQKGSGCRWHHSASRWGLVSPPCSRLLEM